MAKNDVDAEGCVVGLIGLALSVPLGLYRAWVFTLLWAWFVVPTFGLPQIGFWVAYGLSTLVFFLTTQYNKADTLADQELSMSETTVAVLIHGISVCTVALAIGWVVHLIAG